MQGLLRTSQPVYLQVFASHLKGENILHMVSMLFCQNPRFRPFACSRASQLQVLREISMMDI